MFARLGRFDIIALVLLALFQAPAHAVDSVSFDLLGGDQVKVGRVGLQWKWDSHWKVGSGTQLTGYWDTSASYWHATRHQGISGRSQTLGDVGVAAVFRLESIEKTGFYAEFGTGPRMLTELYDNAGNRQSTRFNFGSHIGVGFVWKNGVDLGFKAIHISNASIRKPNDGIDLLGIGLRYRW